MKYIGIDIGKRSCSVCIKDAAVKIVHETKYTNTVHDAEMFIKELPRGKYAAVCESTGNMWLKTYETLEKNKIPVTLANPLKTKALLLQESRQTRLMPGFWQICCVQI